MMFTRPGADHTPSGRYPKESMNRSSARRAAASRSGAAESWTVVAASCAEPLLVESSGRPASAAVVMGFLPELWGRSGRQRSEEHTSELQSRGHLVCRLLLERKKEQK